MPKIARWFIYIYAHGAINLNAADAFKYNQIFFCYTQYIAASPKNIQKLILSVQMGAKEWAYQINEIISIYAYRFMWYAPLR